MVLQLSALVAPQGIKGNDRLTIENQFRSYLFVLLASVYFRLILPQKVFFENRVAHGDFD